MRKGFLFSAALFAAFMLTLTTAWAQTTVSGTVKNSLTGEGIASVSVSVKGSTQGTTTDATGNFRLSVANLPATLVISSVGFDAQEVTVSSASANVEVSLVPGSILGQEVVVAASRTPQRILEAPVTVERLSGATLRNVPAPSYYEAISNLKGVDMHTASLTFRTVTTRGFVSSGNTRLNQLIDGMDNQAPGLNFSVGSVIGITELDVDNIELLSGASSALYGSGGVNGTLLINSKNPFRTPGLSFQIKQGVMNIGAQGQSASPYYDWNVRWAKAVNDKFAFKIAGQFIKARDWEANDRTNVARNNVLSKEIPGDRQTDPNYDGINVYGDETTQNIQSIAQLVQAQTRQGILAATGGALDIVAALNTLPANATQAQIAAFIGALPAPLQPSVTNLVPFYFGLRNNLIPNQNVSRTGYDERHLVDYNTVNYKMTGGLFYKLTPNMELSWNSYFGTGTTVYTGADRYSLRNLKMAQHKLELKSNNWFLRGYTTQENAGDSYQATALGRLINEAWKPSQTWYPQYIAAYFQSRAAGASDYAAHQNARAFADQGRLMPGTTQFNETATQVRNKPIPSGAKFLDRSDLWSAEGQLNFSDQFNFSDMVEVIAGAQWKQYVLNSQGTIFADTAGKLKPAEYGAYVQLRKKFLDDVLTITAAGRYDKHTNFEGRFTPRLTATVQVAKDNNVRLSYQTAYRFPTNQDQYINLNTVSVILIGLIPEFQDYYGLSGTNPGYTAESIAAYRASGNPANTALLQRGSFEDVKPESVSSYELGYRGLVNKRLLLDAYVYYSQYKNFLGRIAVGQSTTGSATGIFNPGTTRNLSYIQNTNTEVKAIGWGLTVEYQLPRNFFVYGNVFSDQLKDVPADVITNFNAPKLRYNLGFRNDNVWRNIGFNFIYKWQDENYYEGTFATGTLPSFGWLDGQITYKLPNSKSLLRIGATNLLNNYQRTGYGNPYIGGLYYASFGYNVF
jgi:outer membrane receptor protein involved in Fe transport